MDNSPFSQLLHAASVQREPQRLLFVFTAAELPDDATPQERDRFAAGQGGTLTPTMCVDKAPGELSSFDALVAEARTAGPSWQVLFAAGLGGQRGSPPSEQQVDQALQALVERVRSGRVDGLLALSPRGEALQFG